MEGFYIKKILVALDGSESSDKALGYALDLADKYSANIELLSVVNIDSRVYSLIPSIEGEKLVSLAVMDTYVTRVKASHKRVLSKALEQTKRKVPTLHVSAKLMEGRPAEKILEVAEEENFDMIVMGSRGLGGITGTVLGSTSQAVVHLCNRPILIVK